MGGRRGEPALGEGKVAKAAKGENLHQSPSHPTLCVLAARGRISLSSVICHALRVLAIGYRLSDIGHAMCAMMRTALDNRSHPEQLVIQ